MATIWLFVEGGESKPLKASPDDEKAIPGDGKNRFGNRNATASPLVMKIEEAFRTFLSKAELSGYTLKVTPAGGRTSASNHFFAEVAQAEANSDVKAYILLIDTEKPLKRLPLNSVGEIDYLQFVKEDPNLFTTGISNERWETFSGKTAMSLCFMVVMMDTWILTDLDNIQRFFSLADPPTLNDGGDDLENLEKNPIEHLFRDWAKERRETTKTGGNFTKTDGYNLLQTTSAERARTLTQCARLFSELERLSAL